MPALSACYPLATFLLPSCYLLATFFLPSSYYLATILLLSCYLLPSGFLEHTLNVASSKILSKAQKRLRYPKKIAKPYICKRN